MRPFNTILHIYIINIHPIGMCFLYERQQNIKFSPECSDYFVMNIFTSYIRFNIFMIFLFLINAIKDYDEQ